MDEPVIIRPFEVADSAAVTALFVRVNRLLAPTHMKETFEDYIASSLEQEINRIPDYYGANDGQFWVALSGKKLAGMFGLEPSGHAAMELRRMYVDPDHRRLGIAQSMLRHAEEYCRNEGHQRLDLSTSEIQPAALSFYRQSGYVLIREEVANEASNKTVGTGIRRYYFEKNL